MLSKGNILRIIIWLFFLIGGAVISIHFDKIYFYTWFNSLIFHLISFVIGYLLLKMVLKGARNTGRFLADNGRKGNIPRLQTNVLVTDGLYSKMRHPMHQALIFFPLSFALLVGSPVFIFIIAPMEMLLMLIMIKLWEEPEAIKKFGDDYKQYMKKVPFFCFRSDCLEELLK